MSDAFYNRMAATASRLLNRFGGVVSVVRNTGGSVNPVTGTIVAGTNTTLTAKGLINDYADNLIDGTRILASDRLLIIDNTFEPLLTDKPTVGGQNWTIVSIKQVKPYAVGVVYFLQVRR
jgi:adhesin HecA-like repeat protein